MTLTRPEFEIACKLFVRDRHDWAWNEHPSLPGFGYIHRIVLLQRRSSTDHSSEPIDDPAVAPPSPDHLTCDQYVVFSPTFNVPTFYFTVHDSSGTPLVLSEIVDTSLLRQHAFVGTQVTPFSIGHPNSNFPLLSFGDHPTLGSQCWYLHPCETGPAVEELLAASSIDSPDRHLRWLDAWFLVLTSVVDLGA